MTAKTGLELAGEIIADIDRDIAAGMTPQRRLLPAQKPRPRPRPRGHQRRAMTTKGGVNFQPAPGVNFGAALTGCRINP